MPRLTYRMDRGASPTRHRWYQEQNGQATGIIVHGNGCTYWVTGRFTAPPHRYSTFREACSCAAGLFYHLQRRIA